MIDVLVGPAAVVRSCSTMEHCDYGLPIGSTGFVPRACGSFRVVRSERSRRRFCEILRVAGGFV